MDRLRLAKYRPEIFQWIEITSHQVSVLFVMEIIYITGQQYSCTFYSSVGSPCMVYELISLAGWQFSHCVCVCVHGWLLISAGLWSVTAIHCCSIFAIITTCLSLHTHIYAPYSPRRSIHCEIVVTCYHPSCSMQVRRLVPRRAPKCQRVT